MTKVLLGYTGKLDTTICMHWLVNVKKYKVIACSAQIGQPEYLNPLGEQAVDEGAVSSYVIDVREQFVREYVFPVLHAQVEYELGYNLAHALSRPIIAKELVKYAGEEDCEFIALGCRPYGNDYIRFEKCISALAPDIKIIYPLVELGLKDLKSDYEYAKREKLRFFAADYDVSQNVWGRCIVSDEPYDLNKKVAESAFYWTVPPEKAPEEGTVIEIGFENGYPVKLNNIKYLPVKLIETLNILGGKHGIGRISVIENMIGGRKRREFYELPAFVLLLTAHKFLEMATLDAKIIHFKSSLSQKLANIIYEGDWNTDLRCALLSFFDSFRQKVSGSVQVKLYRGNVFVLGVTT